MPKFESKLHEKKNDAPLDLREKIKAALKGFGIAAAGIAAFEIATSIGTGDKKSNEESIKDAITPPKKEMLVSPSATRLPPLSYKKPTLEQMKTAQAVLQPRPVDSEKLLEETKETIPEQHDAQFYIEYARTDPFSFIIMLDRAERGLESNFLKDITDAREILTELSKSSAHKDRDTQARLLEALSKIKTLGLLSEEDFSAFVMNVVELHPKAYIRQLMQGDSTKLLPKDPDRIVRALIQDPSLFFNTYTQMGGVLDSPDAIEQAVYSQGSEALEYLYGMFIDRAHEGYGKYDQKQKEAIVKFFPLIENGSMTFDDAATIQNSDTVGYWQRLIEAAQKEEVIGTGSRLARADLTQIVNALINYSKPSDEFFQMLADHLSVKELETLVTYGTSYDDESRTILRKIIGLYEEKMRSEGRGRSWKDSLEMMPSSKSLQMMTAITESGQVEHILDEISPEKQEDMLHDFFEDVRRAPGDTIPNLVVFLMGLEGSSLLEFAKNDIERLYKESQTEAMKKAAILLAGVVQNVSPDPHGSPFEKLAAQGGDVLEHKQIYL